MFKINLAIIGAGYIAEKHLEVLKDLKNVNLKVIYSRTISKANKLAKKYNIKNVEKKQSNIVKNYSIDGILILVSANQIFKITKSFLFYKIPLFIEKPIGLNYEQSIKLININKKYKTNTMIGYNRRFYSVFAKAIKAIKAKGRLLGISIEGHERFWNIYKSITKAERDNWLFCNSIHTIDLIRFFGGDIKKILTISNSISEKNGDQFQAIINFKSGTIGNYFSHWFSPGGWSVKLFGEGVTVNLKPLEHGEIIDKKFKTKIITPNIVDIKYKAGFYLQMVSFIYLIKTGKNQWPAQSLEDTYETLNVIKSFIR